MSRFSVLALLYGDHANLAHRLLNSWSCHLDWELVQDVRLGLNECCEETLSYVHNWAKETSRQYGVQVILYESPNNACKYPMMRRMLYDKNWPSPELVMWFDDDSFLTGLSGRLARCCTAHDEGFDVVGRRCRLPLRGQQAEWIGSQSWAVFPTTTGTIVPFPQGAWWSVKYDVLQRYDWPSPQLNHCGGDLLFGALIDQQNLRWLPENEGVAVNADEHGNDSKSPRRGVDEPHLALHVLPGEVPSTRHDFPVSVVFYGDAESPTTGEDPDPIEIIRLP